MTSVFIRPVTRSFFSSFCDIQVLLLMIFILDESRDQIGFTKHQF